MRWLKRVLVFVVVFVASALVGVVGASAFPEGGSQNCAEDPIVTFDYVTTADYSWPNQATKDRVAGGADEWEAWQDSDGNNLVTLYRSTLSPQVDVKMVDDLDTAGVTHCSGAAYEIELDLSYALGGANYGDLDWLSAHEFGHALGMGHTGKYDSMDGDLTTMKCFVELGGDPDLSQDDSSQAYAAHNTEYNGMRTLTANPSFENNSWTFWYGSGALAMRTTGGGSEGDYYLKMFAYGDYIFQTTRFVDSVWNASDIDARANYKRYAAGGGTVQVQLLTGGPVAYGTDGQPCDQPLVPSGKHADDVAYEFSPWPLTVRVSVHCTPSTSVWNFCTTSDETAYELPYAWLGGDIRIKITNYLTTNTTLYVDNARARAEW